jgi:cell wall-associated NlpC family hydrolase
MQAMIKMESWFNTPERIALLEFKAAKWLGTRFLPNSDEPGRGVSCQKLASRIYSEAGFASVEVPEVKMQHSMFSRDSLVEPFMDARPEFSAVSADGPVMIGDLLGFKCGRCVHHVGIVVSGGFIHVTRAHPVQISRLLDATWFPLLRRIWRPTYPVGAI